MEDVTLKMRAPYFYPTSTQTNKNIEVDIMKSKLRMRNKFFSVGMIVFLMLFIIACGSSDDTSPVTYNISGAVSGATLAGVTINLTGAATTSTTTDASGNFSITGLANGTYTVTPVKAGDTGIPVKAVYTFNPVSSVVVVSGASVANANFVATAAYAPTFSISGAVSGAVQAGVMITLSGTQAGTAITNASGNYSFSGLVDRTYVERHHTVIPSLTGYTFTPGYRIIVVSYGNSTGNNFTSVAVTPPAAYSISGAVSGATLASVTINLTGAATTSTTTDASGNFSITGLANGAYTVTPVKTGYTFTPTSSAVNVSGANITGTNFGLVLTPSGTENSTDSGDLTSSR
ncbi:MAG: SpaA isopeptide-forming pilin-related protein [Deltaproteobacteria bacterium]|nr:SpaA isopeptide-forming pilin-related protein [Deltaproteobacteria bacterium]